MIINGWRLLTLVAVAEDLKSMLLKKKKKKSYDSLKTNLLEQF